MAKTSLVGSFFIGSPLAFVALGVAVHTGLPITAALLVGAALGTLVGRMILRSI